MKNICREKKKDSTNKNWRFFSFSKNSCQVTFHEMESDVHQNSTEAVLSVETAGACGSLPIVTFCRGPADLFPWGGTPTKGQGGAGAPGRVLTGSRWLLVENRHLEESSRRVGCDECLEKADIDMCWINIAMEILATNSSI